MKAEESDLVMRQGLFPNGMTHVLVRAQKANSDSYKWTSGKPTGITGEHDEHFEVRTKSPLVEPDVAMYHYEDIKDPDSVDSLRELNGKA